MSAGEASPHPLEAGGPDLLARFCFWLHFAVMLYIVFGWGAPRATLYFYLCFLPAVVIQWRFNRNSCILNNLESKLRTGNWRNPANPEEGAWLFTLVRTRLGIAVTARQMEIVNYLALAVFWSIAFWRLVR